jgi:hypothetical protein
MGYIAKAIVNGKLKTNDQIAGGLVVYRIAFQQRLTLYLVAAIKFVEGAKDGIKDAQFDEACGVGKMTINLNALNPATF